MWTCTPNQQPPPLISSRLISRLNQCTIMPARHAAVQVAALEGLRYIMPAHALCTACHCMFAAPWCACRLRTDVQQDRGCSCHSCAGWRISADCFCQGGSQHARCCSTVLELIACPAICKQLLSSSQHLALQCSSRIGMQVLLLRTASFCFHSQSLLSPANSRLPSLAAAAYSSFVHCLLCCRTWRSSAGS